MRGKITMTKDFEEQDFSTPDVVSVIDEDGNEHFFDELDRIETDDGKFVALTPVYETAEDVLEDDGELLPSAPRLPRNGEWQARGGPVRLEQDCRAVDQ